MAKKEIPEKDQKIFSWIIFNKKKYIIPIGNKQREELRMDFFVSFRQRILLFLKDYN